MVVMKYRLVGDSMPDLLKEFDSKYAAVAWAMKQGNVVILSLNGVYFRVGSRL